MGEVVLSAWHPGSTQHKLGLVSTGLWASEVSPPRLQGLPMHEQDGARGRSQHVQGQTRVGCSELGSGLVSLELEVAREDRGRGEQGRDQEGLGCQAKIVAVSLRLRRPGMNAALQVSQPLGRQLRPSSSLLWGLSCAQWDS